jgi:glycosyltransferase involved in cell wall biosynthesis
MSVVICAYTEERWSDIRAAVDSVARQDLPAAETILVIDHNPALLARARDELPGVRAVENDGTRGLSDARNRGVREASGEIVAFLDDDAWAEPGWLRALAAAYDGDHVIGVGGSAVPVWRGGPRPGWFPEEFDWVVGCSYRGLPVETSPIRNFLGCNMSFRRDAFEAAGGFHTAVGRVGTRPVGGEETEFCIRVRRARPASTLVYEPAARVHHAVPATRATWRYFRDRCYAEGLSKAIVGRLAGTEAGLASERRHAFVTLPLGATRHVADALERRESDGILRAGAIVGGLAITTAGYAVGAIRGRIRGWGPSVDSPSP